MVSELTQAMEKHPYRPSEIQEILDCLPGITDGSFFQLPSEVQGGKLGWVNGAFFGRGERAMPLFKSGLLRHDFDAEFSALLHEYWRAIK